MKRDGGLSLFLRSSRNTCRPVPCVSRAPRPRAQSLAQHAGGSLQECRGNRRAEVTRSGTGWNSIPGALRWIAVGSASNVWGVNSNGQVYKFNTTTNGWEMPAVPPGTFKGVSTAADGTTLLHRSDGTLWKE